MSVVNNNGGNLQSKEFARNSICRLPEFIIQDICENNLSILDVGCAEGDGTAELGVFFPDSKLKGIDLSESAVAKAKSKYSAIEFEQHNLFDFTEIFDVVFCAEVLEHFEAAEIDSVLQKIMSLCDKHLILLLPYEEDPLISEHFRRFDREDFPNSKFGYRLTWFERIDFRKINTNVWNGELALVIYSNEKYLEPYTDEQFLWDNVAEQYPTEIGDVTRKLAENIQTVLKENGIVPGSKLLELGSGSGQLSACLAQSGYEVTLADYSNVALEKAKLVFKKYGLNGEFILADLFDLKELYDSEYDLVWNSGVMEHFDDRELLNAITSIKKLRATKFLMLVPNAKSIAYLLWRFDLHANGQWQWGNEYLRDNYENFLKQAGMSIIDIAYCGEEDSKWHTATGGLSEAYVKAYATMSDIKYLPDSEKYLIGYMADMTGADSALDRSSKVTIDGITPLRTQLFEEVAKNCGLTAESIRLNNKVDALTGENHILSDRIENLTNENTKLVETGEFLANENTKLVETSEFLASENTKLVETGEFLANENTKLVETGEFLANENASLTNKNVNITKANHDLTEQKQSLLNEQTLMLVNIDTIAEHVNIIYTRMNDKKIRRWLRVFDLGVLMKHSSFIGQLKIMMKLALRCIGIRKYKFHFLPTVPTEYLNSNLHTIIANIDAVRERHIEKPDIVVESCAEINQRLADENFAQYRKERDAKLSIYSADADMHKCEILAQEYKKFDVIFLSIINYDFRHQRPQQISSHFGSNGHRVFYFNAWNQHGAPVKLESENVYTFNIWSSEIPGIAQTDWREQIDQALTAFDNIMNEYAVRDAVVVVNHPNWIHVAKCLRGKFGFKILTDYLDDFTGFQDGKTSLIRKNCIDLLRESDYVIASSQFLYDHAVLYNENVGIVRNGTEYDFFAKAFGGKSLNKRKVVGYYGAIAHWFNVDVVCYVAENLPDCDIVLIGAVTDYQEKFEKYKNIKLLGEKPYSELPQHLETFDVCLIPFDTSTDLIKATNPVKFYEYLSAGKKIVATEIPELEPYRDEYVLMANDKQDFLSYVKMCLASADTLKCEKALMAMGKSNDWNVRYNDFVQLCVKMVPKVSIIVLTYNNLELSKLCFDTILAKTAYPNYEIIIVDNCSLDGTRGYLIELEKQYSEKVKVILNDTNLGFAAGNNLGIKESTGDYIILLNNDIIVTRGWMTSMVKHLENNKKMGMSGAVTNMTGNEAKIAVSYSTLDEMHDFADYYTWENFGKTYPGCVDELAMFATCIKREVIDNCGYLDEIYNRGMFEDDDYCRTVKQAGYELCIAEDVFVHHFCNASFAKLEDAEYIALFKRNMELFEKKWKVKYKGHEFREGVEIRTNEHVQIDLPSDARINGEVASISEEHRKLIRNVVADKTVVIFTPTIDWYMPMFQRPQQMATAYSKKQDIVAIYISPNFRYDSIVGVQQLNDQLLLVALESFSEAASVIEICAKKIIMSLTWPVNNIYLDKIKIDYLIYEHIDELNLLAGYDEEMENEHIALVKRADLVVCTATKLYERARDVTNNAILSTNAGDYDLFKNTGNYPVNEKVREQIEQYECVLGYYGALAEWFDYDLVAKVAKSRPKWAWILVGLSFDGSLEKSGILELNNIIHIPSQPYDKLPSFLNAFDIATIPFVLNEITLATSPVKLFEYMAAGKPILSSRMPECLKYSSVYTYSDEEEIITKAEEILKLPDDDEYWKILKEEALANTWDVKTDEILSALLEN